MATLISSCRPLDWPLLQFSFTRLGSEPELIIFGLQVHYDIELEPPSSLSPLQVIGNWANPFAVWRPVMGAEPQPHTVTFQSYALEAYGYRYYDLHVLWISPALFCLLMMFWEWTVISLSTLELLSIVYFLMMACLSCLF